MGRQKFLKLGATIISSFFVALILASPTYAVTSSLSVAVSPSIDLEIIPTVGGTLSYSTSDLVVNTNNTAGYKILISGSTSSLTNNFHAENISSVTAPTALNALSTNNWGVYLGGSVPTANTLFQPLSTEPTEFAKNDLVDASGIYKLAIGAKVDTSLPAGLYSNQIIISVVATPKPINNLSEATYMQDVTPEICANSAMEESYQLIDERDGKKYWVAKLADGHCWMQQNLDLELSTNKTLTPASTDVSVNYTPKTSTNQVRMDAGTLANTNQYSWNFGKVVIATPIEAESCTRYSGFGSMKDGENLAQVCGNYGFVDVSDETIWKPTYKAQIGEFKRPNGTIYKGLVAVNQTEHTYDAHYLLGTFYQNFAAMAGTSAVTDSICPKGWGLPLYKSEAETSDQGSFGELMWTYGLLDDGVESASVGAGVWSKLASSPLYFIRSGEVYLDGKLYWAAGYEGTYWTRSLISSDEVMALSFHDQTLRINYNPARRYGYPMRCVVSTPE